MAIWNPWLGCHQKSEGCKHCYIFRANKRKGIDTNKIYKTDEFYKPIEKNKKGDYKIKSGKMIFLGFKGDFLVEEADEWRKEAWEIIKERSDLKFLFLTKRIERFKIGLPENFGDGLDNLTVSVSVESQKRADERISILKEMPIKHKMIAIQPMLEKIDISQYLDETIEGVLVGGESGKGVRPLDYEWVLDIRNQCIEKNVDFEFRQVGSVFIKGDKIYNIQRRYLCSQAKKAGINYKSK